MRRGKESNRYEAVVIGAGPGGLVAALYLRRFLRKTALVSRAEPRAAWIPRTHNLLGYRGGISGRELLGRLRAQIDECGGVDWIEAEAQIDTSGRGFKIAVGDRVIFANKAILATGMIDTQPRINNLVRLRRRGLLRYCPVCDAFEYRNKKLLVLAQDAHGIKTARFLARFSDSVFALWPSSQRVPERSEKTGVLGGVSFMRGTLESIDETETGVLVRWRETSGSVCSRDFDAVYVALGVAVQDSAFRHLKKIERNDDGYVLVDSHQETGIRGLFAVGDCVEGLAQIAVAAGQAAIAATAVNNQLKDDSLRIRRR